MHQIYPDVGLVPIAKRIVSDGIVIRLFTNDVTPNRDSVLADFTGMGTGYGVGPITVLLADFTLSGVAGHIGSITHAPIAFTKTSGDPEQAYGYYATSTDNVDLLFAARFDSAPITKASGESWIVTPTLPVFSNLAS